MFDDHFDDELPEGMSWEEFLYFWHEMDPQSDGQHPSFPDPFIDSNDLPF